MLRQYPWPGNVRELENILERSYLFADGPVINRILFDTSNSAAIATEQAPTDLKRARREAADEVEHHMLNQALKQFDGNVKNIAKFLNLSSRAVYQKLATHGLSVKHPIKK